MPRAAFTLPVSVRLHWSRATFPTSCRSLAATHSSLGEEDVLFALSYSGTSIETVRIAELAKVRGATVISVTGLQHNPLMRVADIRLHTVADEERVRSSAITSRDAQLTLMDFLFILILQRQPDANDYVHNSEASVSALKMPAAK